MDGVEITEPPVKRQKLIENDSSIADSSMGESLTDDLIGSKGIKKVEFVRLIGESLYSLGYKNASSILEQESGITLCSSVVTEFTKHILDGNWDKSLNLLQTIPGLDESVVKSSSFIILEQKYLELLNAHKWNDALVTLSNEISPLSINEKRVREFSMLLLNSSGDEVKPKSKSDVLLDLKKLFPPNIMIPQGRLLQLVEQALEMQHDSCSFHNSSSGGTLFSDHSCGRTQIPSQTLQLLQEHQDEVWFVQFAHNGKFLASCSKDKSVIIWELSHDGQFSLKHKLLGHKQPISCVSWSPNDDQILTCGVEEVVKRWDVSSGQCLRGYDKNDLGVISCGWSPDGQRVFSGFNDKSIVMWDLDGNELESWKGEKTLRISDLQITSDGKFIISICKENMILIFDRELGTERTIKEHSNIVSFTLSSDNKFLLVSLANQEIHLRNIDEDARIVAKYKGHKCSRFVVRACFGGLDQAFVAGGSEDSRVYIWHRETGELIETLSGHSGAVNCTSWNPMNPHMLATASDDRTVRIWGLNHMDLNLKTNSNGSAST
ncbi:WD repeat-containing protein 26 homolog [Rutidosis leptorrhynchoides]|uniref:WD repeat-containing protein 26 homolog n=1 Tax=Rutidosis leptorrhynchoides TaxID=125765 RepID=UPI003A99851B